MRLYGKIVHRAIVDIIQRAMFYYEIEKMNNLNDLIVIFDFEYTAWEGSKMRNWSGPGEHREIIQIAAVKLSGSYCKEEIAVYNRLVKPVYNPILSPYITKLTGIDQAGIDFYGREFKDVFFEFYSFCHEGHIPCFCYGDDVSVLLENFSMHKVASPGFSAGIYDLRMIFDQAGVNTRPYTSGTLYQALGLQFDHAPHNALNDVRSLVLTLNELIHRGRLDGDWSKADSANAKFEMVCDK